MKKVYICTPLKSEKFEINSISKIILKENIFAFIPPSEQLLNKKLGAKVDQVMIRSCDELWVFGNFGRDCAWEIGFAQGLNKKVKIFVNKNNKDILKTDWMTLINVEIVNLEN